MPCDDLVGKRLRAIVDHKHLEGRSAKALCVEAGETGLEHVGLIEMGNDHRNQRPI
jgi:hypothetical protein